MTQPSRHHHLDAPSAETARPASTHAHIWLLLDGTPAHAPPGELTRNDQGKVACHLCGNWFDHLGAHLRRHGWSAAGYRRAVGLPLGEPLCNTELSDSISHRQTEQWNHNPAVRERLAAGHDLARSGILAQLSHAARVDDKLPETQALAQRRRLDRGRATRLRQQQERLMALVASSAAETLAAHLAEAYRNGASITALRSQTGLSHERVRTELLSTGTTLRPTGHNTPQAKRDRARHIDQRVADRVGVTEIRPWLQAQRAQGCTMIELADATGRSTTWVRSRLSDTDLAS